MELKFKSSSEHFDKVTSFILNCYEEIKSVNFVYLRFLVPRTECIFQ